MKGESHWVIKKSTWPITREKLPKDFSAPSTFTVNQKDIILALLFGNVEWNLE